jgi:adenosyl cobinamide kinase/adenosyl cobinamide phosphate guanylyltransferase
MLIVLLGGARSGKSALAQRIAGAQPQPVVVIATAEARDGDMADRIARHRADRPAGWQTIEEPLDVAGALADTPPGSCAILDDLTVWVSNLMEGSDEPHVLAAAAAAAAAAARRPGLTIAVSNETGLGVVPVSALGRHYRDVLGRVNAIWAAAADESYLLVAGRLLALGSSDVLVERLAGFRPGH